MVSKQSTREAEALLATDCDESICAKTGLTISEVLELRAMRATGPRGEATPVRKASLAPPKRA